MAFRVFGFNLVFAEPRTPDIFKIVRIPTWRCSPYLIHYVRIETTCPRFALLCRRGSKSLHRATIAEMDHIGLGIKFHEVVRKVVAFGQLLDHLPEALLGALGASLLEEQG